MTLLEPYEPTAEQLVESIIDFAQRRNFTKSTLISHRWGAQALVNWLKQQDGTTWQVRWLSGEPSIMDWQNSDSVKNLHHFEKMRLALTALLCLRLIRPSYQWLHNQHFNKLHTILASTTDREDFEIIKSTAIAMRFSGHLTLRVMLCASLIAVHTGKRITQFTIDDLAEYDESRKIGKHKLITVNGLFNILRQNKIVEGSLLSGASKRIFGKLSPEDLLDKHGIFEEKYRFIFGAYLRECQLSTSPLRLKQVASHLLLSFWFDILLHHPEQTSFQLSWQVAHDCKQRQRYDSKNGRRIGVGGIFKTVRSFYEFLDVMASQHPEEWAIFAAHSPVSLADLRLEASGEFGKNQTAKNETLKKLPYLKIFREELYNNYLRATKILEVAMETDHGEQFTLGTTTYQRAHVGRTKESQEKYGRLPVILLVVSGDGRKRVDAEAEEQQAFWMWASIEIMLGTGLRPWELYRLQIQDLTKRVNDQGKVIPCIVLPAGKTTLPRLVDLPPSTFRVISKVVERVRGNLKIYPRVQRFEVVQGEYIYDAPLLLQKVTSSYRSGFHGLELFHWLKEFQDHLRFKEILPNEINFKPRDCRRIVATRLHLNKVPILDISRLLGHKHVNTTINYIAHTGEDIAQYLEQAWAD